MGGSRVSTVGVTVTARPLKLRTLTLKVPAPGLQQLAASILAEFGVTDFPRRVN